MRVKGLNDSFKILEMSGVRSPIRHVKKDIQESMSQVSPFIPSFIHSLIFFFNKLQTLEQVLRIQQ